MSHFSHNESYDEYDSGDESEYDDANMYNIFHHELKLAKKKSNSNSKQKKSKKVKEIEETMKYIHEMLSKLKFINLEVNRVHIRYEDDYFAMDHPFSFGAIIEKIDFQSVKHVFDLDKQKPGCSKRPPRKNPQITDDWTLKELQISGVQCYWNSMSEMFIPTSLWESTRGLKYQIFEAMPASDLCEFMLACFDNIEGSTNQDTVIYPTDATCLVQMANLDKKKTGIPESPYEQSLIKLQVYI